MSDMSESEDQFQQIVQALTQMVWTCDATGACDYVSPQWVAFTGIPASARVGFRWLERMHPDDRPHIMACWQAAVDGRSPVEVEARIRRSDGEYRWFNTRGIPRVDHQGTVTKWFGSTTEIHELRQSREQLLEVLEYSLDASFRRNLLTDTFDYLSPIFSQIAGYDHRLMEAWSSGDILALVHLEDRAEVQRIFEESRADGTRNRYQLEYRFRHRDGHFIWVRARYIVVRDADGRRALARVGSLANINEIKEAEEETRAIEARGRKILDSMFAFVGLFSRDGDLLEANKAPLALAGLTREDVIGRPMAESFWFSHAATAQAQLQEAMRRAAEGEIVREDMQVRVSPGRIATMDVTFSPLFDENGRVTQVVGSGVDVTDRLAAEVALFESEQRFRRMIDNSPVPCALNDDDQQILYVNPAFVQTFGWNLLDIPTLSNWWHRAYPDAAYSKQVFREWRARLEQAKALGRPFEPMEVQVHAKDGTSRTVVASAAPLSEGFSGVHLVTLIDITARRAAEVDRAQVEAQLHQAQKMEAVGTLAGGIAHDFNNILGAIIGNVALAAEDLGPGHPVLESLEQIDKSSRRAADLVKQLLAISRPVRLERQVVDLPTVIRQDAPLIRAMLPAGVELAVALDDDVPAILAHPTEIHQVLLNLCTNAGHAMARGGGGITFTLDGVTRSDGAGGLPSVLEPGRYARLAIRDTGTGMDAATLDRIFDPFFTTKEVGQGTGLGLTMVHRIMTSLRGAVTVASDPGKGTVVTLYFPRGRGWVARTGGAQPCGGLPGARSACSVPRRRTGPGGAGHAHSVPWRLPRVRLRSRGGGTEGIPGRFGRDRCGGRRLPHAGCHRDRCGPRHIGDPSRPADRPGLGPRDRRDGSRGAGPGRGRDPAQAVHGGGVVRGRCRRLRGIGRRHTPGLGHSELESVHEERHGPIEAHEADIR